MGCGNCGTGANGAPSGCKSNGGCSTGGCNRLNVYDWLNALPLHDSAKPYPIIEVSFSKGSRKEFFRNNTHYIIEKGTWLAVEGLGGYDIGQVSLTGELVKLQLKKYGVRETDVTKRVLHPATEEELEESVKQKNREPELLIRSRAIARSLKLEMKLCEIEIQADSKKGTFFYTADQRVDFRELIKLYAGDFKMKVEMRQIGARQESGKVGGIGSCGRELCCSTWLTDFKSVNTTAARYQNLSINQTKLSGQCGRLKCCLNYELDTYMDALSVFPDHAESLETIKGIAHLQKRDIFKNLMWYSYSDNNKQYPLSIERVKEIKLLNKQGQKAEDLQPVELEAKGTKDGIKVDMGFVNDVGQLSLRSLEKNNKKKKHSGSGNKNRQDEGGRQQGAGNASAADGESAGNQPRGNRPRPDQGARGPQNNQPRNNRPRREDAAATGEQLPKTNNQPKTGGSEREPQQARNPHQKGQQQQGNRPPRNNDQQGRKPEGTTSLRPPRDGAANPENGTPRSQPNKRPDRPQNNQNQQKRPQQQRPNQSAKPTESENKPEGAQ